MYDIMLLPWEPSKHSSVFTLPQPLERGDRVHHPVREKTGRRQHVRYVLNLIKTECTSHAVQLDSARPQNTANDKNDNNEQQPSLAHLYFPLKRGHDFIWVDMTDPN